MLSIATELLTERSEKSLVTDRKRFELVTFSFYPYLGLFFNLDMNKPQSMSCLAYIKKNSPGSL